jgi:hypothetical protein
MLLVVAGVDVVIVGVVVFVFAAGAVADALVLFVCFSGGDLAF